jgi:hypothetical protein
MLAPAPTYEGRNFTVGYSYWNQKALAWPVRCVCESARRSPVRFVPLGRLQDRRGVGQVEGPNDGGFINAVYGSTTVGTS